MSDRAEIEQAFQRIRAELEIRTAFPPEVEREAERSARGVEWRHKPDRQDLEELPFITIDPAGSRDLDQALFIERRGDGYRVHYAIADVSCFVARGSLVEEEAWRRGLTYYSPDRRDPLYPPVISQEAGSLLPDQLRPAIVFQLDLDPGGELASCSVRAARIRSRAQLTYPQALEQVRSAGALFSGEDYAETLLLLREVGERRIALERARGGVSLPILEQHVTQKTALRLGYELVYEDPNAAEDWNAQISLLTGHAAAERMLAARVGLLRVAPPPRENDVRRLRTAAQTLGFEWPETVSYPEFIHSLSPTHPLLPILVWQARQLMKGADYLSFEGEPPNHRDHTALAMTYAHCTAPLRRLADRYVLDLLVALQAGHRPSTEELEALHRLPEAMDGAERRSSQLERRVVDLAEAWELRTDVGEILRAVVLEVRRDWVEVQIAEPPVRTRVPRKEQDLAPGLGEEVEVRVAAVAVAEARVELELVEADRVDG